jgi:hypothetical protein
LYLVLLNIPKSILKRNFPKKRKLFGRTRYGMAWWLRKTKPGLKTHLGLIKFLFQLNAIYLHDTPAKSLFNRRREPSVTAVLEWKSRWTGNSDFKNDKKWMNEKIRETGESEERYTTKKNPRLHWYFTAGRWKMKFILWISIRETMS